MVELPEQGAPGNPESPSRKRLLAFYVLPTFALLLFVIWSLATGTDTLFFRDVFNTHLEMKWWQAESMGEGFLPLVDPYRSGGQPHLGNPNTVALYPDNLLYLLAPLFWAFNAHFWVHLLLAPACAYWLGRRLGLEARSAWAAGVFYGASGYFFSTLNLYNLVAGAALIPAFLAAILGLSVDPERRWRLAAVGGIWCLLLLAGDPMTAALALGMGLSTLWLARPGRVGLGRLAMALGFGTLLAAPQWVEFLRIVELSFRGHQGYSAAGATVGSWHPATVLEWFIPFAFGGPDLTFWGQRFHSGTQPLFYSFYPGWLALACFGVGVASMPRRSRLLGWSLALIALGLFLALGGHNPIVSLAMGLPGLSVLRLPVKFWPLVAIPAALVAGRGFELCSGEGGPARLRRAALILLSAYASAWFLVAVAGSALEGLLAGWMPPGFADSGLVAVERARWAGLLAQSAGLSLLVAVVTLVRPRVFEGFLPVLLGVHLLLQLALLAPLYRSEDVSNYRLAPPPALAVPQEALAAHGASGDLFGRVPVPVTEYPSPDPRWMQRQLHYEASPYVGMMARRRFEFALSPEGLDAFLTRAATEAFQVLSDVQRIRFLEASGVSWLYMKRELAELDGVEVAGRFPSLGEDLVLYRLSRAAEPVQFVGELLPSDSLNEALSKVTSAEFRPREQIVIAGSEHQGSGKGGSIVSETVGEQGPESWGWTVDADGAGALLIQRAHLPIYRIDVDGVEVKPLVANLHRMAVPLDRGRHVVRLWVDRRPLHLAASVAVLTAIAGLLYVAGIPRGRRRTEP